MHYAGFNSTNKWGLLCLIKRRVTETRVTFSTSATNICKKLRNEESKEIGAKLSGEDGSKHGSVGHQEHPMTCVAAVQDICSTVAPSLPLLVLHSLS